MFLAFSLTEGLTPKQWQSRLRWWLNSVNVEKEQGVDPILRRILLVARSGAGQFS